MWVALWQRVTVSTQHCEGFRGCGKIDGVWFLGLLGQE